MTDKRASELFVFTDWRQKLVRSSLGMARDPPFGSVGSVHDMGVTDFVPHGNFHRFRPIF